MDAVLNAEQVLLATLDEWAAKPFVLGETDCGMSAALYLQKMYDYDCAESVRDKYHDLEELSALLGPLGLGGLMRRLAKKHSWRRVKPEDAETGAVGLVFNGMTGVVVCRKKGWFIGKGQSGISLIPAINPIFPKVSVRVAWDTRSHYG